MNDIDERARLAQSIERGLADFVEKLNGLHPMLIATVLNAMNQPSGTELDEEMSAVRSAWMGWTGIVARSLLRARELDEQAKSQ